MACDAPGAILGIMPLVSLPIKAPPVSVMLQLTLVAASVPMFLIDVFTLNNPPVIGWIWTIAAPSVMEIVYRTGCP